MGAQVQRGAYSRVFGASTAKRPAALGYAGAGPALRTPEPQATGPALARQDPLLAGEYLDPRLVYQPVGGKRSRAVALEGLAGEVRDPPARLRHDQAPGRHIPRRQSELPKAVHPTGRDRGEIHRSRPRAPEPLRSQHEPLEVFQIALAAVPVIGEARHQERLVERRDRRHVDASSVEQGALAYLRLEEFLSHRIIHHAEHDASLSLEANRDAERGEPVREVRRAIQWVHDPPVRRFPL